MIVDFALWRTEELGVDGLQNLVEHLGMIFFYRFKIKIGGQLLFLKDGKMLRKESAPFARWYGAVNIIFQFSYISRPRVFEKEFFDFSRDFSDSFITLMGKFPNKIANQNRNVGFSLP